MNTFWNIIIVLGGLGWMIESERTPKSSGVWKVFSLIVGAILFAIGVSRLL